MSRQPQKPLSPPEICRRRRIRVLTAQGYVNLAGKAAVMLLAAWLIFTQVFMLTQCPGMGMFPAVEDGDLVLLSPACSSFDRFSNFAERGDTFKAIVYELEQKRR